jgi:hypothetical protein
LAATINERKLELYNYKKTGDEFIQTIEYISIRFLSEFNYRGTVEQFVKKYHKSGLTIDDFDFLTKADDSHMRERPIEYPFFKPMDIYIVIEKLEKVLTQDAEKFEKLKSFLLDSDTKKYWVQALTA